MLNFFVKWKDNVARDGNAQNWGLSFLSILSLYGICGDFLLFYSGRGGDLPHSVISAFIFCVFLFEVVHEHIVRPAFLCTARDATGWIYILSTSSFLLDATLVSRRLYAGEFIYNGNPPITLDFFPGRICIALTFFVYGIRCLQAILRFTISMPFNSNIRQLFSVDASSDLGKIDEIGSKLAQAHSTLHTKLGLCIISFISVFGALQYNAIKQSSWDMFQLPLDSDLSDSEQLWQKYEQTFSELHYLCDSAQSSCYVPRKDDDSRDWTMRTYTKGSVVAELDGTDELERRALFYLGNVICMAMLLGVTVSLVEFYLRTNIENLLLSESASPSPIEENTIHTVNPGAPDSPTENSKDASRLRQTNLKKSGTKIRKSRRSSRMHSIQDLEKYLERIVHSVSRGNLNATEMSRSANDFESPLEKATSLLKSIINSSENEEETRRIRLAYEIMLSDHSLQGKMTHVIAQSSHLTGDARRWLLKTVSSKVNFSANSKGGRKSKFKTRINVADFQKRASGSSKSTYGSRISESFMISPLNVVSTTDGAVYSEAKSTSQQSIAATFMNAIKSKDSFNFTYDRQDSENEEQNSDDLEDDERIDYYEIFSKEKDDEKRFESLQIGTERLEITNEGVIDLRWDIDSFRLSNITDGNPLVHASLLLIYKFDLPQKLNLDMPKFYSFLDKIQYSYNDNIYHNRCHATDVTISGCCLIGSLKPHLLNSITHLQIFAVIFSCIIHDVGHPGNNNLFETKTNSRLALRYSDQSVLEYYHLALAFRLMRDQNNCFNEKWDAASKQNFRKQVVNMVLATDLSNHFKILDEVKQIQEIDKIHAENDFAKIQTILFKGIIKMGDLSHACKPIDCHLMWTQKINDEFCRQGDKERELGLEISPLCDRKNVDIPNGQLGFFQFIVQPLFKTCERFFDPDGSYNEALNQIDINFRYWQERVKEAQAKKLEDEEKQTEEDELTEKGTSGKPPEVGIRVANESGGVE